MTYKEKQTWALLFSGLFVLFLYLKRVFDIYAIDGISTFNDTNFWAKTMLVYIGIGIGLTILVMILFNVFFAIGAKVKNKIDAEISGIEEEDIDDVFDNVEDEMDRLINLKAGQISYVVVSIGFVAGLVTLTFDLPFVIMLNIVYLSFMIGACIEGIIKLNYYKKGVSHG